MINHTKLTREAHAEATGSSKDGVDDDDVSYRAPDDSPSNLLEAALAVGFFFAAMLSALMAVSGAHINPAVSIGLLVARHCSFVRFFFYVIAQCAGAITGKKTPHQPTPGRLLLLNHQVDYFFLLLDFKTVKSKRKTYSSGLKTTDNYF